MLKILLIDDDEFEHELLTIHLKDAGIIDFDIHHVKKCSGGVQNLLSLKYDVVLLDNSLADGVSSEFSVPFIKEWIKDAPLIVISNNIDVPHLLHPDILGVDFIVDKKELSDFLIKLLPILPTSEIAAII